uniref:DUF1981 domain-containing protein n=1 Tax=Toxocara canis TaxID=6265 RepID=A0A183U6J5_TOXCA
LIEVIKAMRGADSDVYRTADVALKEIWNRLIEETHIVSSDHVSSIYCFILFFLNTTSRPYQDTCLFSIINFYDVFSINRQTER